MQYGINLVVVVFNNGSYGNVMRDQKQFFGGRVIGSKLSNPDFIALARSFGMAACKAETPEKLETALERALGNQAPALIEVPIATGTEYSPWEFLKPNGKPAQRQNE